jgi:hypothetical protein
MKRYGNLFDEIASMDNLHEAHKKASKGKGHYKEVVEVNKHEEFYLQQLHDQLMNGTYQTNEYRVMERVEGSKLRVIHVLPYFPDRIVHHAIMQVVGDIWKRSLIRDTFQSLKGRGTSDARRRVQKAIRKGRPTYYLQMDIKKFYPSVKQQISKLCVRRHIKCPRTLVLLDNIIESVEGLPIGNYISQMLGNMVLSTVDWYAKQNLKVKYYFRYCDDLIVLGSCKKWLRSAQKRIEQQVNKLGLIIKPTWIIQSLASNGLDFCGYVFFSDCTRLRATIKYRYLESVRIKWIMSITAYWGWIKPLNNKGLWQPGREVLMNV